MKHPLSNSNCYLIAGVLLICMLVSGEAAAQFVQNTPKYAANAVEAAAGLDASHGLFFPSGNTLSDDSSAGSPTGITSAFITNAGVANRVQLSGHVLPALARATPIGRTRRFNAEPVVAPLTLTVVLRRSDESGFNAYLVDVYNPQSPNFHRFLTGDELAERFGPSPSDYAAVRTYFMQWGFSLVEESANRMTLTIRGTRTSAEGALGVQILDYALADRGFYANSNEPMLPAELAAKVQAIAGLSNLASANAPTKSTTVKNVKTTCTKAAVGLIPGSGLLQAYLNQGTQAQQSFSDGLQDAISVVSAISLVFSKLISFQFTLALAAGTCAGFYVGYALGHNGNFWLTGANLNNGLDSMFAANDLFSNAIADASPIAPRLTAATANNQKIGLLEFDTFQPSDVLNWLNLVHADPTFANHLSEVHVNGGVSSPGAEEAEVLLDIATVMLADPSANTSYVVYDAPRGTSFQQMFNAMINGGVTVISNSWTECEDQHSLADVQSIDSVLAQAAASGISVLSGSGDSGSGCLDGSPNTVGVPASSPHGTAVGGTSPTFGPLFTYGGETWWNGSADLPQTGQGGFGVSRYFLRPAYQNGLIASAMRSVPDVAVDADPAVGLSICQADAGGCPTGLEYGGTSMAAPMMAGMVAYLNENLGTNLGQLNQAIYPLAGTNAFHSAASMGIDFAHVGLGSPNFDNMLAAISNYHIGPVDPSTSHAGGTLLPLADGATQAFLRINLNDANNFHVPGKTVSLTPNVGSHAIVSAAGGPSDDTHGSVTFTVTDAVAETVTFTVTDTTDGVTLTATPTLIFVPPPAAGASIAASPSPVTADGASATTITVTLFDSLGRPSPGKTINISQGGGHSAINGPSPAVTNAGGQIQFTATDKVAETVMYTAVDVTDGNLPVPGSASITFNNSTGTSCVGAAPTAASGFTLTPLATGFLAQNFSYSGISFSSCPGASSPAFDTAGNVYVSDSPNGNLYKFSLSGGAVSSANALASLGLALGQPVFGKDGSLYVARSATGSGTISGTVLQIDPSTGALIRTVASGLTCPSPLAVDPLSGDLFFTDICTGGGLNNPSLFRIAQPNSATPSLSVYATLPGTPNGAVAIAPNGTIYVAASYTSADLVVQVSGTNTPSPATTTTVAGINSIFWVTIGQVQPNGAAKSLVVLSLNGLSLVDMTTTPFTVTPLTIGQIGSGTIGPDGCLYMGGTDTIYKLAPSTGVCGFVATNPSPALNLTPTSVSPSPAQGNSQTFTATFTNINVPASTPVFFQVQGANPQLNLATTNSSGTATFTYTGISTGTDTITANASVGSSPIGSNLAQLTWVSGKHVTFLDTNLNPSGAIAGQSSTLTAVLYDLSANPATTLAGATVTFNVGGLSCNGITNGSGVATCSLNPGPGNYTLTVNFAGNGQFTAVSAVQDFFVPSLTLSQSPTPVPTPTLRQWMQIILAVVLALLAIRAIHRRL